MSAAVAHGRPVGAVDDHPDPVQAAVPRGRPPPVAVPGPGVRIGGRRPSARPCRSQSPGPAAGLPGLGRRPLGQSRQLGLDRSLVGVAQLAAARREQLDPVVRVGVVRRRDHRGRQRRAPPPPPPRQALAAPRGRSRRRPPRPARPRGPPAAAGPTSGCPGRPGTPCRPGPADRARAAPGPRPARGPAPAPASARCRPRRGPRRCRTAATRAVAPG